MSNYGLLSNVILVVLFVAAHVLGSSIHGGTFLAMTGEDSVVLVSDSRFSSAKTGTMLLGKHPRMIFRVGSRCVVGCFGLDADSRTLVHKLRSKLMDHMDSDFGPEQISRIISNTLYDNNFVLSPIITGLRNNGKPYICTMDGLGAQTISDKFAVVGTANEGLFALCESLYVPDLEAEDLIVLAEKCFDLAIQRDVMSGGNFRVVTVTKEAIHSKDLEKLDT